MDTKTPAITDEEQLLLLWGKVGFIVNLSQMIEYTIANIIVLDEYIKNYEGGESFTIIQANEFLEKSNFHYQNLLKKTMGAVIKETKETGRFNDVDFDILSEILKRRNYIIHDFFVEDLQPKIMESNPKYFFPYLEKTIEIMYKMNVQLNGIFASLKKEVKMIY